MKIVEFRLVLPLTPEEYRRCQIFLVALAALETAEAQKTTGAPAKAPMIEVLATEDYVKDGETGQFTHKRIDLAEKLPGWLLKFVDPRSCAFEEKSWNAFPHLRTEYESKKFPKAKVSITSNHLAGVCTDDNATGLPPEKLRMRRVDVIDIVNDKWPQGASGAEDLRCWRSEKAGFGPLRSDWISSVPLVPVRPPRPPRRGRGHQGPQKASQGDRGALESTPGRRGDERTRQAASGGRAPETNSPSNAEGEAGASSVAHSSGGAPLAEQTPEGSPVEGRRGLPQRDSRSRRPSSAEGPPWSPPLEPAYPLMTCYKCFEVEFPYFGLLAGRIENWVVASMREQLMMYHRRAIACIDRWYDLSLEEVRRFEEDVKQQLSVLAALSRNVGASSGGPCGEPRPRSGGPQGQRAALQGDAQQGPASSPKADTSTAETTEGPLGSSDSEAEGDPCEGGPQGEGALMGAPQELLEALNDWRVYTGARLLPLRLSAQSVSLLQRLQQQAVRDSAPKWGNSASPRQQQQQEGDGGSWRPQGPAGQTAQPKQDLPIRHGYLEKLADGLWGLRWNPRYFLLRGPRLQYFDDPRDARAKQSIALTGAKADWAVEIKDRPFAFYVEAPGKKKLILSGESEEHSLAWLSAVQSAAVAAGSSSSSSSGGNPGAAEEAWPFERNLSLASLPGGALMEPPTPCPPNPPEVAGLGEGGPNRGGFPQDGGPSSQASLTSPLRAPSQGGFQIAEGAPSSSEGPPNSSEGPPNSSEGLPNSSEGAPNSSEGLPNSAEGAPHPPDPEPLRSAALAALNASALSRPFSRGCSQSRRDAQPEADTLEQQVSRFQAPLKEVVVALTQRGPRTKPLIGEGLGAPHMIFLRPSFQDSQKGPGGAPHKSPALRRRSLSLLFKETERDRPSFAAEAVAVGTLASGVLLLLLSVAAVCCCCSSLLFLLWRGAAGPLGVLLAAESLSDLLQRGFCCSLGPLGVCLLEGLRAAVAAAAAVLLLRGALWVLAGLVKGKKGPRGPQKAAAPTPLLKAVCLAEGPPTSLLVSAIPPEATPAAAEGPSDPSVIAAGGPFLMETVETLWPLELLLLEPQAFSSLVWGLLQSCFPRCSAAAARGSRWIPYHRLFRNSSSSNGKQAAPKRALQLLLRLLLQQLQLIATAGALALGGALGALLAAAEGFPLTPLELRRVSWCSSLDGGGYLLLSVLSPLRGEPPASPDRPASQVSILEFVVKQILGLTLRARGAGAPGDIEGFEAVVVSPVPQGPPGANRLGSLAPQQLQHLQQQHRRSLASLRFGAPPLCSPSLGGPPARLGKPLAASASRRAARAPSGNDDLQLLFDSLPEGSSSQKGQEDFPAVLDGDVGGPCVVTWVGGLRLGTEGAPHWLGPLLTVRRAEAALGALLSQAAARRVLPALGVGAGGLSSRGTPSSSSSRDHQGPSEGLGVSGGLGGKEQAGRGVFPDLEKPLTEFYQTVGGLGVDEARDLSQRRAFQRRESYSRPYPLAGWRRGSLGALEQQETAVVNRQRDILLRLLQRQRADLRPGVALPTSVLLPVGLLRASSLLPLLPECCSQGPPLLEPAVNGGPLERLKATIAFSVSILHRGCWQAPPFAASLGETFQGHLQGLQGPLGAPQGGWLVYAEQTAVDPPSTLFCVSSPGTPLQIWAHLAFSVSYQQNRCSISTRGRIWVCFDSGDSYSFSLPVLEIRGLLWGPRLFSWKGPLQLQGPNVRCTLTVGGGPQGAPVDEIYGEVEQTERRDGEALGAPKDGSQVKAIITGSYTDRVFWNETEIWSVYTARTLSLFQVPDEEALPIDSRFRRDTLLLSLGREESAHQLRRQALQREAADKALRESRGPSPPNPTPSGASLLRGVSDSETSVLSR